MHYTKTIMHVHKMLFQEHKQYHREPAVPFNLCLLAIFSKDTQDKPI